MNEKDLLRKRTGKRISLTKRIKQIDLLVSSNGEKSFVTQLCDELRWVFQEAEIAHENYMSILEEAGDDEWLVDTELEVDNCICRAQTYVGHSIARATQFGSENNFETRCLNQEKMS